MNETAAQQTDSITALLSKQVFNNSVRDYAIATGTMLAILAVCMLIRWAVLFRLKKLAAKTTNDLDDLMTDILGRIGAPVFVVISLYVATLSLELEATLRSIIRYALVFVVTFRLIRVFQELTSYIIEKSYRRARPNDPGTDTAIKNLRLVFGWALWILGAIFIADNLGINISAMVAGLGIGGIAIAMASQAVLGDAFSAVSIFLDKPFQVGDFIIVGDLLGTVEHVGIKTTRIRSLHGEQLVFSNADLTGSRIRNYKRMDTRRIAFSIGVTYQTTSAQVKKIPVLTHEIFAQLKGVKLDRVHFKSFGDFALIYEIVYYVLSPDYNIYMDKQQEINFALKDVFEREGIEFAYPTQTLYVSKE